MDVYRRIGRRIASLRRGRKWTQEHLAERAGIGAPYLARIEGGGKRPTVATLAGIAQALDVPLWRLFAERQRGADAEQDRALRALLEALDGAAPSDLEVLAELLRRLRRLGD